MDRKQPEISAALARRDTGPTRPYFSAKVVFGMVAPAQTRTLSVKFVIDFDLVSDRVNALDSGSRPLSLLRGKLEL
jgi:hypothetical protein